MRGLLPVTAIFAHGCFPAFVLRLHLGTVAKLLETLRAVHPPHAALTRMLSAQSFVSGRAERQHDTKFVKYAAQRIGLHDAKFHQPFAHAVQCQNSLLLLRFDGNEMSFGLLNGYSDCPCIGGIGLVAQYERVHRLG